ncbi:MAG: hypothetical protein LBH05_01540 [Deferribacteraceae bacterium]|jgi:hypothetical protein|nr:hypothetical protein [Deferribacteraceae bacterium]
MPFKDPIRPDIENVRAGERWNDGGLILTATDFQNGLKIGRFAQIKNGIQLANLDGSSTTLVAGVALRSVVNPIESGDSYDAEIHREAEYKREGLVTVEVVGGVTPKIFDKCYAVNSVGNDSGKATGVPISTVDVNAEFIQEVQTGVWLVNLKGA